MGVEVYVWAGGELRRVDVVAGGSEGIQIVGVCKSRARALRDRIYAITKREGLNLGNLKLVVVPPLVAGSTEGVEIAALIAAWFADGVQQDQRC